MQQFAWLNSRLKSEQVYLAFGSLQMLSYGFCFLLLAVEKTGRITTGKEVLSVAIALLQLYRAKCRTGHTN